MVNQITSTPLSKRRYLLVLFLGFAWTIYWVQLKNLSINEVSWIFWSFSFVASPLIAFCSYTYSIRTAESAAGSRFVLAFIGKTLVFALFLVISAFVHSFIGVFQSVILPMEPAELYGRNGFINHFHWRQLGELTSRQSELLLGFLCVKSSILLYEKEELSGSPTLVQHGVLAFIFGAIASLAQHWWPIGIWVFAGLYFFPWKLVVARDIHAKARVKEADLNPKPEIPAHFVDHASPFWGLVFGLFGLVFLLVSPMFFVQIMRAGQGWQVSAVFFAAIFFLAFAGFGGLAALAGLSMIFGYQEVWIHPDRIQVESRFRQTLFRTLRWTESRSYYRLEKSIKHTRDSDGPDYTTYTIEYRHPNERKKDVTLYRSYHEEGFEGRFMEWKEKLGL